LDASQRAENKSTNEVSNEVEGSSSNVKAVQIPR